MGINVPNGRHIGLARGANARRAERSRPGPQARTLISPAAESDHRRSLKEKAPSRHHSQAERIEAIGEQHVIQFSCQRLVRSMSHPKTT